MSERIPCEFFLVRYVPDVVKGEFTNIGVVLREVVPASVPPDAGGVVAVRFTRDWTRVLCMEPDADIAMLEALEAEMSTRLAASRREAEMSYKPLLTLLADILSNGVQLTEQRGCLTESVAAELEQLMRLYVEPLPRQKVVKPRTGRAAIVGAMRSEFERAGVWSSMNKRIAASRYTRPGDPMRLDCGYAVEVASRRLVRAFHAVSLDADVEGAKVLAYSAPLLREGVARVESADLQLTAVIESLRSVAGATRDEDAEVFDSNAQELYQFGVEAMERQQIRVITLNDLARAASTARLELRL
jgi:hypothetical protein